MKRKQENYLKKEFRIMIAKMIKNLENKMEKMQESINRDLEELKKKHTETTWRRKWQPAPVFLPGKSHGWRSLVGYCPWGRKESDTTERLHYHCH